MRNSKSENFGLVSAAFLVVIVIAGATGWIKNVIKLSDCDFESPYKEEVIRAVGIIPPVGAVVGYINFED